MPVKAILVRLHLGYDEYSTPPNTLVANSLEI